MTAMPFLKMSVGQYLSAFAEVFILRLCGLYENQHRPRCALLLSCVFRSDVTSIICRSGYFGFRCWADHCCPYCKSNWANSAARQCDLRGLHSRLGVQIPWHTIRTTTVGPVYIRSNNSSSRCYILSELGICDFAYRSQRSHTRELKT